MLHRRPAVVALLTVVVLAACSPASSPTPSAPSSVPTTGAATATPGPIGSEPAEPSEPPVATVSDECMAVNLGDKLKNAPRLTLSTDIPAYPPWWGGDPDTQYPNEPEGGSGWELSDPYSQEGYESAVAYAVAAELGFGPEQVDWVQNAVFEQAFAPGRKPFDYHLAQISIRPRRARAVDFSDPYFDANQAIIALTPNAITGAATIADLKAYKLGAGANTTSFDLIETVIQPDQEPSVFNDNAAAIQALKNGQIHGLVVDLQTAFYIRDAQLEDFDTPEPEGTVVGQFDVSAQVDQMGIVLQKDSPLTACVNEALGAMVTNGTLDAIYDQWISTGQEIPFFE